MFEEFSRIPLKLTPGKNIFSLDSTISAVLSSQLTSSNAIVANSNTIVANSNAIQALQSASNSRPFTRSDNEEVIIKELKEKQVKLEARLESAEKKIEELIKINKDLMEIMKNK